MKISNKSGLPQAIINAISNDKYDKGDSDFTVTELLKPPRQRALELKHQNEIEEDAQDMLYRLYGQIAHGILERANDLDLCEKRFYANFLDYNVSAQIDTLSLSNGTLTDYKFSTAWGFKQNQEPKDEWVKQLNMQLEILRRNGLNANKLQIVGLIRDFSLKDARQNPDSYPQNPIVIQNIPIWDRDKISLFIEARLLEHIKSRAVLPECSPEERWATDPIFAVVKGKRAVNGGLCQTIEGAEAVLALNPGTFIQHRPAVSRRCEDYCKVNQFCEQYKRIKKGE